jgi:hypothetical protein
MKHYFFLLAIISIISFSSFVTNKTIRGNSFTSIITDSTPVTTTQPKVDSVWIGGGYGWTHHTYHWIPAHWEPINSKHAQKQLASSAVKDSTQTKDSTTKPRTAEGRVWVSGHREFIHNNWVWVNGHWQAVQAATK